MSENKLTRSADDKVMAGICGGIADYLEIDSLWVRLLFVLLIFASGIGFVIYLVLWFIMPQADGMGMGTAVLKENLDDMSQTVSSGAKRINQPGGAGIILISLGVLFLLYQIGWFGWLGSLFWPALIIGIGFYMLSRRKA